jgi:hypothetical protein
MGYLGLIVTDGSPEFRKGFDATIPDWQFAACESDTPSLSRPDRFVERGVSLGAVVIEQGDHLFFGLRHAKGSDVCIEPILSGQKDSQAGGSDRLRIGLSDGIQRHQPGH